MASQGRISSPVLTGAGSSGPRHWMGLEADHSSKTGAPGPSRSFFRFLEREGRGERLPGIARFSSSKVSLRGVVVVRPIGLSLQRNRFIDWACSPMSAFKEMPISLHSFQGVWSWLGGKSMEEGLSSMLARVSAVKPWRVRDGMLKLMVWGFPSRRNWWPFRPWGWNGREGWISVVKGWKGRYLVAEGLQVQEQGAVDGLPVGLRQGCGGQGLFGGTAERVESGYGG